MIISGFKIMLGSRGKTKKRMEAQDKVKMDAPTQKIWNFVKNLEQGDDQATALCYSIINLMIKHRIVTKEEAARQIEKSVAKVVTVHKRIVEAMEEKIEKYDENAGRKYLH